MIRVLIAAYVFKFERLEYKMHETLGVSTVTPSPQFANSPIMNCLSFKCTNSSAETRILPLNDKICGYPHKAGQSLSLKWLNLLYSLALAS